jgi:hypothetical protein
LWQIAGHNKDKEEDSDKFNDSKQLETLLGAVKQKQVLSKRNDSAATVKVIGHCNVVSRKRKAGWKRPVLQPRQKLPKQRPAAVIADSLFTSRAAAGRNIHTRPQARAPQKLQEYS